MNMQKKPYTIFLTTHWLNHSPKKKSSNAQPREDSNSWRTEKLIASSPSQPSFVNWEWHLWYGIFPLASLAVCLAMLRSSSCTIWETEKYPWFHSNNWKHQC